MSDIEDRIRSWFASEVGRAERDLATSRATWARVRRRRPIPRAALAGLLVALVVLAVAARPNVAPDAGKGPVRSPTSVPHASGGLVAFAPEGIPTVIDGVRVLSVVEAIAHAQAATNDEPFVVGGWWTPSGARCAPAARRIHPLISICSDGSIQSGPSFSSDGLAIVSPDEPIYAGPIVVQVHTRDPRAKTCPADRRDSCLRAVIVDRVLWRPAVPVVMHRASDGIPTEIAGEGIYRASHLGAFRLEPGAFLVAGWAASGDSRPCPAIRLGPSIPVPPTQCTASLLADERDGPGLLLPDVPLPRGPVVLRVRLVPEAACPAGYKCKALPRVTPVEEFVWAGDTVTATDPLTIAAVFTVLREELGDVWVNVQPGLIRPGNCDPRFPSSTWRAAGTDAVGYVVLFPSVAARAAGEANFHVDGYSGIGADGQPCRVIQDGTWRWVAVDNVLVQVLSNPTGIAADALAERIQGRLEAIAP